MQIDIYCMTLFTITNALRYLLLELEIPTFKAV